MVAPAVGAPVVIGLDAGGTTILSGLVERKGNLAARREAIDPADARLRIMPDRLGPEWGLVGAGPVALEALDGIR